ncbi:MAG: EAL domain-containing protein [Spirochaetia bacterium]
MYYQPKLNIKENKISGAEALIRWNRPDGTAVAPGVFIPLAESNGLIYPIGEWVMRRACTDALEWIKEGHDLSLAVNLSGKQFYWEEIIDDIEAVLSETGFPPANLNLEITENAVITDTERAIAIMKELSRKGIQYSLDDFGTGYSSLSYLKKFPLSVIKVYKSFI